jgi:hypothetical protein
MAQVAKIPNILTKVKPDSETISTNEALTNQNVKIMSFFASGATKKIELYNNIQKAASSIKFINKNYKVKGHKVVRIGNLYFSEIALPARRKFEYKLHYS